MIKNEIGDIQAFAAAVAESPEAPDLNKYLSTLDLTTEERDEVKAQIAEFSPAIARPTDSPVPSIVAWWTP